MHSCSGVDLFKRALHLRKVSHISTKEPYISAKEPHISTKDSYIFTKELYISAKHPYMFFVQKPRAEAAAHVGGVR